MNLSLARGDDGDNACKRSLQAAGVLVYLSLMFWQRDIFVHTLSDSSNAVLSNIIESIKFYATVSGMIITSHATMHD
eukprot:3509025-Amphidinium_carterae.1